MKRVIVKFDGQEVDSADLADSEVDFFISQRPSYTCEVVDLDTDYDYQLSLCRENRAKAYPSFGDIADAYFKKEAGDSADFDAIVSARAAIKAQFPKPAAS